MADRINVRIKAGQAALAALLADIESTLTEALRTSAQVIKYKVMDFTPRWKGGLVQGIKVDVKGREARVFGEGVVMAVHEKNAVWSRLPPVSKLQAWFMGKLGFEEKKAKSAAWGLAQRIKKSGLMLPNKEGRGQMFARTFALVERTQLHWQAFMAKMRQLERRGV